MAKKLLTLLLAVLLVFSLVPCAFAAGNDKVAADTLHELGLFEGVGANANGKPNYDLNRAPTRNEAVTMLVRLLGKEEAAKSGDWEIPFTDVAAWAKPYVGYAYANGLTNGTSATTYSGNATITASQYLTFVLRALGYDSSTDFKWNAAWEKSDKIGLTDGSYNERTKTFLRGDVALISRNALDVNQKDSSETLADKLISEGVFSKDDYGIASEEPVILKEEASFVPDVLFEIDGRMMEYIMSTRAEAGTYHVVPYLRGSTFADYEIYVEEGSGSVKKHSDGSFTVNYKAVDSLDITMYYDIHEITEVGDDGKTYSYISKTKRNITFAPPVPKSGFAIDRNGSTLLPGAEVGDNYSSYFVLYVYYDGVQLDDYTVTIEDGAPFTPSIQADGSLLLMKTANGHGKFTVTYQGHSATFQLATTILC